MKKMNEIKIFNNPEFGDVRTMEIDDKPYFCASDVAKVLGYSKPQNAIAQHCKGALKQGILTSGGIQEMTIIPENDVYRLVFRSKLPSAEHFVDWVTSDVLPSIRKTGSYSIMPKDYPSALRALADEYEKNQKLLVENQAMKPKAEYFDVLVDRNLLTNFRTTAKELHIKQNQFIRWLLDNKFVYRDKKGSLQPYSKYTDYFHIKDSKSQTGKWAGTQTLITPKGKEAFRLLLGIN